MTRPEFPLGDFQDISIQGPKTETLVALVPPVDEIRGALKIGASVQHRNTGNDFAGWIMHSVSITATSLMMRSDGAFRSTRESFLWVIHK